jgi:hypothetical protein
MLTGKAPVRSDGTTIAKPPTRTMVVNKTLKQKPPTKRIGRGIKE